MNAQHTPGKLRYGDAYSSTFRLLDETVPLEHSATAGNSFASSIRGEANARRLVACWNALDGISTTEIEAAARSGSISYALAKVIAQRNELLDALKHIGDVAFDDEWRDLPEIAKHARAAIAKAGGAA